MDLIGKMNKLGTAKGVAQMIARPVVWPVVRASLGGIPANVLRNDDGTPIRNDDGGYIYTR